LAFDVLFEWTMIGGNELGEMTVCVTWHNMSLEKVLPGRERLINT